MRPVARPRISAILAERAAGRAEIRLRAHARFGIGPRTATKDAFRELVEHVWASGSTSSSCRSPSTPRWSCHRTDPQRGPRRKLRRIFTTGVKTSSARKSSTMIEEGRKVSRPWTTRPLLRSLLGAQCGARGAIFEDYDAILTPSALGEAPVGLDSARAIRRFAPFGPCAACRHSICP